MAAMPTWATFGLLNYLHPPTTCCAAPPTTLKGGLDVAFVAQPSSLAICQLYWLYVHLHFECIRPASQGLIPGHARGMHSIANGLAGGCSCSHAQKLKTRAAAYMECYLLFIASRWSSCLLILLISALRCCRSSWSPCVSTLSRASSFCVSSSMSRAALLLDSAPLLPNSCSMSAACNQCGKMG